MDSTYCWWLLIARRGFRGPRKKTEQNLDAKNKVLGLFEKVAKKFDAAGSQELALA